MIKNYIKTAWRNIRNNVFYSSINIIGLAVGLTVGLLILLWIQSEMSYNHFDGAEQNIYKVNSNIEMNGEVQVWPSTPGPVAAYAKKEIPGVKRAVRVGATWHYSVFSYKDEVFEADPMAFVDPEFFDMFQADFLEGNAKQPFIDDQSIILTERLARKYFGDEPALGKTIQGDFQDKYTVSGVVKDLSPNSSVDFAMLFPISIIAHSWYPSSYWESIDTDWGNFNYRTYLELNPNTSYEKVRDQLSVINARNDRNAASNNVERAYELQQISQMNLYHTDGSASGIQSVRIFIIIAVLILLIASINYVNLSTARAIARAKEVSMRKIIGAQKNQLFFQFIFESLVFILLAIIISFGLIFLLLPAFNAIIGKELSFNLSDPSVWKIILSVGLFTTLASSVYPAILLSSFKPLEAIKGKLSFGLGNNIFRHILVTVQFVFSVALIIGTVIISQQLDFLNTKDPGYDRSQTFTFNAHGKMSEHMNTVKSELSKLSEVEGVTVASRQLYNVNSTTGDTDWEGRDPDNNSFVVKTMSIDENFIPMMKMELAKGSNFTGSKADSTHYILNETAIRLMGLENPIGKRFALHEVEGTIIGVVKDFNMQSMKLAIEPIVINYNPSASLVYVKMKGTDAEKVIETATALWDRYNSGFPFKYTFMDEGYNALYKSEQRTAKLFNIFCILAVFVACLGLFGLATYTAKVRTKEIGIRKVVGASVLQITGLLSVSFLKLIVIAILIASPLAYLAMTYCLQDFTYRISIEWSVFAITSIVTLLIALITVSSQAIKAAIANPVDSLRDE